MPDLAAIRKRYEAAKRGNCTTGDVYDSLADIPLLVEALEEAQGLLRDYVRIYPNNSGRTVRFLARILKEEK